MSDVATKQEADRVTDRVPMVHILDALDPEFPHRALCGARVDTLSGPGTDRADCVVCVELDKTHDWGPR